MITVLTYRAINLAVSKENFGIFLVYLFHVSALIGISLGYFDWFVQKTPLNLSLMCVITYWLMKPSQKTHHTALAAIFILGMLVEILGVNYSLLFGSYSYGDNLGLKLLGVPVLIGLNWALLTWVSSAISNRFFKSFWPRVLSGSILMLFLDLLMEPSAPHMDFWAFAGGHAPLSNYYAWFGVAVIMHVIVQQCQLKGRFNFSLHYFISQILFFAALLFCC